MTRPPRHQGLTLPELLVALAVGLLLALATLQLYLESARQSAAQLNRQNIVEDAQAALTLLTRDLQMAGYGELQAVDAATGQVALPAELDTSVFACAHGFVDDTASTATCALAPVDGFGPGLELAYQADLHNTVPVDGDATPSDCTGQGLTQSLGRTIARNRYSLVRSSDGTRWELACASPGKARQPLIDNVDSLSWTFGLASGNAGGPPLLWSGPAAMAASDWSRVVAVRTCLVLRSASVVPQDGIASGYLDCAFQTRSSTDGHQRMAFVATVALRNRLPN